MLNSEYLQPIFENNKGNDSFEDKLNGRAMHYKKCAYNWLAVSTEVAPCFDKSNIAISQSEDGCIYVYKKWYDVILLLLNGKFFMSKWLTYGDDFHLTTKDLLSYNFNFNIISEIDLIYLRNLSEEFKSKLNETIQYKLNAGKNVGTYNTSKLWYITDKSDMIFYKYMCDDPITLHEEIENHIACSIFSDKNSN